MKSIYMYSVHVCGTEKPLSSLAVYMCKGKLTQSSLEEVTLRHFQGSVTPVHLHSFSCGFLGTHIYLCKGPGYMYIHLFLPFVVPMPLVMGCCVFHFGHFGAAPFGVYVCRCLCSSPVKHLGAPLLRKPSSLIFPHT